MNREQQVQLTEEARADHQAYISALLAVRDRLLAVRQTHAAEAWAGHPSLPAGTAQCVVCAIILQTATALGSDTVIDHEALNVRLDEAEKLT